MPIHVTHTTPIERVPDLLDRPVFTMPWTFAHDESGPYGLRGYFWRMDEGGDIYRVEVNNHHAATNNGDLRRY